MTDWATIQKMYPLLQHYGVQYQRAPNNSDGGNLLEFWPPGEAGTPERPRPKAFSTDKPGVEVFSDKVSPLDVLGDITSHYLVNQDPTVKQTYGTFSESLTDHERKTLSDQYQWAVKNEGEKRPYADWLKATGLPAMFRGYMFQQWPKTFNDQLYTPAQIQQFNTLLQYLQSTK